jgi:hypothetical protein
MNKYRNKKTFVENLQFDSKKEAARYVVLREMERTKEIEGLKLQPTFKLAVGDFPICKYRADFEYILNGQRVVEDVKGMKTAIYRIKKKLVKAIHGIDIHET